MRTILHLDMDAFYASVEQRDNPSLKGKPVIVGAAPDQRGVVCAASYEARTFGIHSAMPSRTAGRLCPDGVFLPVRMEHYVQISGQLQHIMESFTPILEPLSLDEAFLDVTGVMHHWREPVPLAQALKQRIADQMDLPCSVGVARNKFLAKLASDLEKPDGLCLVPGRQEEIETFLAPLPVGRIWGVGKVLSKRLHAQHIFTIADLQQCTLEQVQRIAGSKVSGAHLWALARGLDDRPVEPDTASKSISREHTFGRDCRSRETLHQTLLQLAEEVGYQLRKSKRCAGCVYIKFRTSSFQTYTRQQTVPFPVSGSRALLRYGLELLDAQKITTPVRLIGFGVSHLVEKENAHRHAPQPDLFETPSDQAQHAKDARLDCVVDALREKYGQQAILRGDWKGQEPL